MAREAAREASSRITGITLGEDTAPTLLCYTGISEHKYSSSEYVLEGTTSRLKFMYIKKYLKGNTSKNKLKCYSPQLRASKFDLVVNCCKVRAFLGISFDSKTVSITL